MLPMMRNGFTGWFHSARCWGLFCPSSATGSRIIASRECAKLLETFYGFERQLVQALAIVRNIGDDLIAHARLPKFLEVIGDTGDRLIAWIGRKEQGDLVRPVNHAIGLHVLSAWSACAFPNTAPAIRTSSWPG